MVAPPLSWLLVGLALSYGRPPAMIETDFDGQLRVLREAWDWSRHHAYKNRITSRPRERVFAELDVAGNLVLEAIARLAAVAATEEHHEIVAEVDHRYGETVRDERTSRRKNPEWLAKLSSVDGRGEESN
jgi:hypothetical protein